MSTPGVRREADNACVETSLGDVPGPAVHDARHVCDAAVADGYLRMSPDGEYVYPVEVTTVPSDRETHGSLCVT